MTEPTTDKEPETGYQPAPPSGPADAAQPAADAAQPAAGGPAGTAATAPTADGMPADGGPAGAAATAPTADGMPEYKGGPLDPDRGPGLGCFWAQVVLLVLLLVLTPLSVYMDAPSWLSATLLILILVLLFFVGQTMIFLLRLVAADRRTRRRPIAATARRTVGQLEDAQPAASAEPAASDKDDSTPDEPLT